MGRRTLPAIRPRGQGHPLWLIGDCEIMADPFNESSKQIPPHPPLRRYYPGGNQRHAFVTDLFDRSALDYDWINNLLSLGSGGWYRQKALCRTGLSEGMSVLDVACGTGLVTKCAIGIVGTTGKVVGMDASSGMLHHAQQRGCNVLVRGKAEVLSFRDAYFDFVTMGYALRHVSDLRATFMELFRVLKPGGALLILEVSRPSSPLPFHVARLYLRGIVPWLARLRTGQKSAETLMRYFWDTIEFCQPSETILAEFNNVGFRNCRLSECFGGLIRDYSAVKP